MPFLQKNVFHLLKVSLIQKIVPRVCTTSKIDHLSYNNHISISKDNAMVKNVTEGATVQKFLVLTINVTKWTLHPSLTLDGHLHLHSLSHLVVFEYFWLSPFSLGISSARVYIYITDGFNYVIIRLIHRLPY